MATPSQIEMDPSHVPYRRAGAFLKEFLKKHNRSLPRVGIICGTGLSGLAHTLDDPLSIDYGLIPGFPAHCTVSGHAGEVVFGSIDGISVMCFRGRFHSYEGHDMKTTVLPVLVMRCLAVPLVILTNAAGGLNLDYNVGDVVIVTDHIALPCLAGKNSLVGPNDDELGPRFPPTSNAYPSMLREIVMKAGKDLKYDFLRESGTYCFVSGPMYESKAECRLLQQLGGDCVGMSTIPEVVAAHHAGMQVLCLSLITNIVVVDDSNNEKANHEEVLEAGKQRSQQVQELVRTVVQSMGTTVLPQLKPLDEINLKIPRKLPDLASWCKAGALVALGFAVGCRLSFGR